MQNKSLVVFPEFLSVAAELPKETKAKLFRVLRQLSANHRHPGLQTKKIQGSKADLFECRVDDSIRLIYDLAETNLRCWFVGAHDTALKFGVRMGNTGVKDHVDDIEVSDVAAYAKTVTHYLQAGTLDREFVVFQINDDLSFN